MTLLPGGVNVCLLLLAAAALLSRAQQYSSEEHYKVTDDDSEPPSSSTSDIDYSKYFGAETAPVSNAQPAADAASSGFVKPIDFSALFAASQVGGGAVEASASRIQDFFKTANSDQTPFALPLTSGASVFPHELVGSATENNGTGFTSPQVRFQSLFDHTGSASEIGFRPQDFLRPPVTDDKQTEESSQVSGLQIFSPSFSKLDKEYNPQPGPSYTQTLSAVAAPSHRTAAEVPKSKHSYRVPASESYEDRSSYRAAPSEQSSGKSSYPAPSPSSEAYSGQYSYKPSDTIKSSYPSPSPSAEAYSGKYTYRPSEANQGKSNYRVSPESESEEKYSYSPVSSSEYYSNKPNYRPSSEEKVGYSSKVPVDVYGGKSSYKSSKEPHQGKSSYPGTDTVSFNGKYGLKPVPSNPTKINSEYFPLPTNQGTPYSRAPVSYSKVPTVASTRDSYSGQEYRPIPEASNRNPKEDAEKNPNPAKDKKCKKVAKTISTDDVVKGRFRREAMTCYVCEDPKTGGNYEECSYASDPNSKSYFVGHAQSYSTDSGVKPTTYRYRRYLGNHPFGIDTLDSDGSEDTSYDFPSSFEKDNYKFGPQDFTGSADGGSEEYSSAAATLDNKNCQKVQKDSMTCFKCKDPKTGGSYEQCSYASEPKKQNYFVARESSFNSKQKPYIERYRRNPLAHSRQVRDMEGSSSSQEGKVDHDVPLEFAASTQAREHNKESRGGIGLDPYLYGAPEPYDPKKSEASTKVDSFYAPYRSYEDYFRHLFPELEAGGKGSASEGVESYDSGTGYSPSANSEQKTVPGFEYKTTLPEYFTNNEKKKDLDAVLGEFTQKDRSDCKRVIKDKMTCYQCVDKKGMQQEECMFVAASEPKSQHLAYHEVKEFRLVPPNDQKKSASSAVPAVASQDSDSSPSFNSRKTVETALTDKTSDLTTTVPPKIRRKAFFKKVTTTVASLSDSKVDETVDNKKVKRKPATASLKKQILATTTPVAPEEPETAGTTVRETVKSKQSAPAPPELSELDRSPDGLYSAETKQVFDPVLKVTLPEYMLTRSEHEAIFDEVMASGRRR